MTVEQGKAVYRMPSLGSDMEAGTLIEWVKQPGDRLAKGDVIAVVETQKGAIEVEVFQDAVMGRILVEPGESVPVGTPMAELEGAEVEPRAAEPAQPLPRHPGREVGIQGKECKPAAGTEAKASDEQAEPRRRKPEAGAPSTRRRVSPAARRLAEEHHIDLATMTGSGPDGAITLDDVRAAAKPEQPAPSEGQPRPRGKLDLAAMREAIAAAMSRSKRTIPHYYLGHDIDLTPAAGWLAARNAELPPDGRLLMGVLLIKAVAVTLHAFPELNGFDRDGRFEPSEAIHIGTATAIRGGGLVAPAIHDADQLDLATLMDRLRDLVARVRGGSLRSSELSDPTITVSSLGERGVQCLYGIIYPPQVAIVGFGTPQLRPWVVDDGIVPRTLVTATLSADHRHSDGHRGALFLAKLAERLQEPDTL
jgi:pyruvate dehydrogenase E2 component (dihydrolipoamide acetyltransferase)